MRWVSVVLLFFLSLSCYPQTRIPFTVGVEQDVLPYLTQGYYAAVWAGQGHWRLRALTAKVTKPDFLTPTGFTNNQVNAYAILIDYFLRDDASGWWLGAGYVYWQSSIALAAVPGVERGYNNQLLNGSIGYQWKFYKQWYLSPWAGMSMRTGGPKYVSIDQNTFKTSLLNPELSLKIGWYFLKD